MTDFRARPALLLQDADLGACLRLSVSMTFPGEEGLEEERALLERVRASLPDGVRAHRSEPRYEDLIDPPGPEPFADKLPRSLKGLIDTATHWARLEAARDRLERAGIGGAREVMGVMSGWVRLMEGLAEGLPPLLETDPEGRVHIRQIKEKFGTLRVYANIDGPDRFQEGVREVIAWATAASARRCALTGRPGVPDNAGWYLILSREAILWRANQPEAFREAIYPKRPDPARAPEGPCGP
jgi:hypothetical protein